MERRRPQALDRPQAMTNETQRPSTTTAEQNLHSAGQRRINLIWEYTQAAIAGIVVVANIIYIFVLLFVPNVSVNATTTAGLLANAFFLVIGFYFGRTNHARIGDDPSRARPTTALDDR